MDEIKTTDEKAQKTLLAPSQKGREWFLYLTGFFSGMSVMAIELGASRLLAPYFSASQIVWTIVIGTIMIAMALGNLLGGKMADKHQTPDALFIWLLAAATWSMLIPLCGKFVIGGVALGLATFVTNGYLIWAALISCLLVFVFPLLVLGMVTPNIVKYAVNNLAENGKVVGRVEAFNTIGSIIGTFLPTFVTIPYVGTSWTFTIFSCILYAICLVYFIFRHKFVVRSAVIASIAFAIGITSSAKIGVAFWDKKILYEGESIYNYLRVEQDGDSRILSTNVLFGVQSIKNMNTANGPQLTGMYYDYAMAAPLMSKVEERKLSVLVLGLGTGTFCSQCLSYFPAENLSFDGVEIDQKIVDLAYEYFALPSSIKVTVEDGRAFLNMTKNNYDVILVDAYRDITVPFQMSTLEFFTLVKNHLNEGGTMVMNINMQQNKEGSIDKYLCGTVKSVFPYVYTCSTSADESVGTNQELYASQSDCLVSLKNSVDNVAHSDLKNKMNTVITRMKAVSDSSLMLTDDKAPVEKLGTDVLDETISSELSYYRDQLKNMSFKEIWEKLWSGQLF
jgi:spermidine synthase